MERREAGEQGYKLKPLEVYHFKSSRDLFKGYIRTFYALKCESSAPPEGDPDVFIEEYRRRFGIIIDKAKLLEPENPGLRQLAKLCLNNLW